MDRFQDRLLKHAEHVKSVGAHCTTEETTKQALILPLLDILGFSPYDPTKVKAEYGADFPGVKANERVDYALFNNSIPVMFIEAKPYGANLSNHAPQLSRYFNATPEVAVAAITNGSEWRFFTDLNNKNMMDDSPFLTVSFDDLRAADGVQLARFHHDQFEPGALRALAEESVYLSAFKSVVGGFLRDPDIDFVKFVASRANVQRQFNAKFLDGIAPIVRQAVAQAVSEMVATSLSSPAVVVQEVVEVSGLPAEVDDVHPDNDRIVTTVAEKRLFALTREILGGECDITAKDTESYFTVLYQGKTNRWLYRFYGDKKRPALQFVVDLSQQHLNEVARAGLEVNASGHILVDKPDNLLRLTGLLFDALAFCQDDENFRQKK